jgi:tRNA threonylcarbamoyl adenosine modification protein (Sua5/YciO/YrdC/YwlC family)
MLLKIYPENPNPKAISKVVECLSKGCVVVFPTDTIYALGCSIDSVKGYERICKIIGVKPEKANFSLLCADLSHLSDFCLPIERQVYKIMRKALPGPYTFILKANNSVPKLFRSNKKTIGIRIPDCSIILEVIKELGMPLISTSIHSDNEVQDYLTDPEEIEERYNSQADLVVDGGAGGIQPSTVVDCTGADIVVVREGRGEVFW